MSAYLGIDLGPTAKMKFTDFELRRFSNNIKLRKGCRERDGKFICYLPYRGHDRSLGTYSTAKECNRIWDLEMALKKLRDRKPAKKGYGKLETGEVRVAIGLGGGKSLYLGIHPTEEIGRKVYLEAFEKRKAEEMAKLESQR